MILIMDMDGGVSLQGVVSVLKNSIDMFIQISVRQNQRIGCMSENGVGHSTIKNRFWTECPFCYLPNGDISLAR